MAAQMVVKWAATMAANSVVVTAGSTAARWAERSAVTMAAWMVAHSVVHLAEHLAGQKAASLVVRKVESWAAARVDLKDAPRAARRVVKMVAMKDVSSVVSLVECSAA